MNVWKPIDRLGYAIFRWWTPALQVRSGVLAILAGIALALYGPFAGEPFLVYEMSAFALVLAGLGILVTAVLAVREDPDTDESDLDPDTP